MSSANVDFVRRSFEAFTRGDPPLFEEWHPDFVWDMSTYAGWPEDQTYPGVAGFARFIRDWSDAFDDWRLEVEQFVDGGEKVGVILLQRGIAKVSGAAVEMRFGQVWSFQDGKLIRVQLYADPADALAAAGVDR